MHYIQIEIFLIEKVDIEIAGRFKNLAILSPQRFPYDFIEEEFIFHPKMKVSAHQLEKLSINNT